MGSKPTFFFGCHFDEAKVALVDLSELGLFNKKTTARTGYGLLLQRRILCSFTAPNIHVGMYFRVPLKSLLLTVVDFLLKCVMQ